jgi:multidrug transporter EmrE-like cation transporter
VAAGTVGYHKKLSQLPMAASPAIPKRNKKLSIALVFLCTLLGAAAQILMKTGSQATSAAGPVGLVIAIFSNLNLFIGYSLYGLSTAVLIVALKYGELSILYPVIALTYVWVTGLSVSFYNETLNVWKVLGLTTIVMGVGILGKGMKKNA